MGSWVGTAHTFPIVSFAHSWALQAPNINILRALLNTGGLKICFKSNTCLYSLLNQNENPVCWHSLSFTRITPRRMKWVCNFQQNNRLTKLSRATNKEERNKAKIFICPWIVAESKGRHRGKSFFSPLFSLPGWRSVCLQLHSNRIISLAEMNSARKQLLITGLQMGCPPDHQLPEPGRSNYKCVGLKECLLLITEDKYW